MSTHNKALGKWGEEIGRQYLASNGYRIEYLNYRCPAGEIDIVASKGGRLVFVEVKTRRSTSFGFPAEAVNYKKQSRYLKTALYFINDKGWKDSTYRFDIIEVMVKPDDSFTVNHIEDAFRASGSGYYY